MPEIEPLNMKVNRLSLSTRPDVTMNCLLQEFDFDDGKPTYLKEIHFSNVYTHRISAKVFYVDQNTSEESWSSLFKMTIMPDANCCPGACANVKVVLPTSYETVTSPVGIRKICFLLQQPSKVWKEFSITDVKFYDSYKVDEPTVGQSDGVEGATATEIKEDSVESDLKELSSLIEFQRDTDTDDLSTIRDISDFTDSQFELK